MKKTLIPEGTPLFENIARNQIPEILESLSAVQKDYHKNEGILPVSYTHLTLPTTPYV